VERPNVASRADWVVGSYDTLMRALKRYKVGWWLCSCRGWGAPCLCGLERPLVV